MKQILISLCMLGLPLITLAAPRPSPWAPSVRILENRIAGQPAESHQSVNGISMVILDKEGCDVKVLNPSTLEFSDSCHLLQGYYKYTYQTQNTSTVREVYVEFLLTRQGSKSKTTLVNSPIYLENGRPVTNEG